MIERLPALGALADVAICASSVPTARLRRLAGPRAVWLRRHEFLHRKDRVPRQDVEDGPADLVGEDRERLPLAVFLLQGREEFLPASVMTEKQHRGFREGPFEMHVPHLRATGPEQFAAGLFPTLDEPGVRSELLHAIESTDVMNLVEDR